MTPVMRTQKMAAVIREQDSPLEGGKRENLSIGYGSVCVAGVQRSQHIVPQPWQFGHNLQRDILIRVECRH
jgi:hypothetical protein